MITPYSAVVVDWEDAFSSDEWAEAPVGDPGTVLVRNIGYVSSHTDKGIHLFSCGTNHGSICHAFFIPQGMIRSITVL